ncbi:hypothetical protein [Anaerosacchariphilus polymeriproducens]|uniref:Uncharacterized protein n=1 Tax=Anaerosacchariphilus polymeriproducens TaxID=1812858 RepID=A0A371AX67_9FIRM|nr:hypothetical protein [Anaerosacchariphilus polymeriproducens]RDU24178.1 hypothetical protein DWV06_05625 [Anaerosacchariphilus polymeriproducens]
MYEDGEKTWSIELVGTDSFDLEDEDWSCDEVFDFGTRDNPLSWIEETSWNVILDKMIEIIRKYLAQGLYSGLLKEYQGISIGFVDGDIEILFTK